LSVEFDFADNCNRNDNESDNALLGIIIAVLLWWFLVKPSAYNAEEYFDNLDNEQAAGVHSNPLHVRAQKSYHNLFYQSVASRTALKNAQKMSLHEVTDVLTARGTHTVPAPVASVPATPGPPLAYLRRGNVSISNFQNI
jgi:hypothetical protein